MSDLGLPHLKQTLNRGFDLGQSTVGKSGLEHASEGDLALAMIILREWHSKGYIELLRSPFDCGPDEVCFRILKHIDG